jgi:hypothetical protein
MFTLSATVAAASYAAQGNRLASGGRMDVTSRNSLPKQRIYTEQSALVEGHCGDRNGIPPHIIVVINSRTANPEDMKI